MVSSVDILDLHWLAGFYEGEGTVCAYATNGGFLSLVITQKNLEPIKRCMKKWGGRIYDVNNYDKNRHYSQWIVSGSRAAGILMTIYSLLSNRRQQQIAKALSTWRTVPSRREVTNKRRNPITGRYGNGVS